MGIPVGEDIRRCSPLPGFPSPAPRTRSGPIQADCVCWSPCPTAQPGFRAEDRGAPGRSCSRGSRLAGTALSHGLCWTSHQHSWQTSPFTHPYQGPDGRGADGPFESLPSVPPQDTLKGKPWKSLFYFGPTRASSMARLRRGWAGGNGPRRRVRPEGPRGNIQHKVQTTTTTSCPPSWSTCTGLTRHFKHFTSPSRIQAPSRSWDSNRDEHEPSPLCRNISRAAGHLCLEGTRAEEQSTGKSSSCHQGAERARGVHLENKKFGETLLQPFGAYRGL